VGPIELVLLSIFACGNYDFRARQAPVDFPEPPAAAAYLWRKHIAD
jgi:hypothetical protein